MFFDQDLLSTVVYARHYYGDCPPWIERLAVERLGDLYLLCPPDVPWSADRRRDRPAIGARRSTRSSRRLSPRPVRGRARDGHRAGARRAGRGSWASSSRRVREDRRARGGCSRGSAPSHAEERQQERAEERLRPEDEKEDARDHPAHRLARTARPWKPAALHAETTWPTRPPPARSAAPPRRGVRSPA